MVPIRKLRSIPLAFVVAVLLAGASSSFAQWPGTVVAVPAPSPGPTPPMFPYSQSVVDASRPSNGFTPPVLAPAPDLEWGTFSVEYLRIWYPQMNFPRPTLTTGSATDAFPGAVGNKSTFSLFGNGNVQPSQGPGFRIANTIWLVQPALSITTDFWSTGTGIFHRTYGSTDGSVVVSRPFFNPASGQEEALPISLPNAFSGTATDSVRSRMMGADSLIRWTVDTGVDRPLPDGYYLSFVGGPKWIQLDESYSNQDLVQDLFFGTKSAFADTFATRNSIYGGVFGVDFSYVWDQLKFDLSVKGGVGVNKETVNISGTTTVFGSEEYPEFAPPNGSGFPDIFGFFVNGKDVAFLPGTNSPVTINTVNPVTNGQNYISNEPAKFNTQLDGFTTVLTVLLPIAPGVSNHIKLAIADASDGIYDSDVMIRAGSLKAGKITLTNPLRWTYNPATKTYAGSEILANTTPFDIPGPLYVVLSNPPPGIKFVNAAGVTSSGQSYVKIPGTLKAGGAVSVLVMLSDPSNLALNTYFNVNSISLFNTIPT